MRRRTGSSFTLGNSSNAFISLRSQSLGVAVRDILLVVIAFNFTNVIVAWPVGALNMVTGLVFLPASILAGLLWDRVGPQAPFWFGAGCGAAAVVLLGFIQRRSNES